MELILTESEIKSIKDRISLSLKEQVELEVIFKSFPKINGDKFKKILGYFSNLKEETNVIDIRKKKENIDIRLSISGVENIKKYCVTNKIDLDTTIFLKKDRIVDPIELDDYNIKINLNNEIPLTKDQIDEFITNFDSKIKIFRYKKRFTSLSQDGLFKFDFTIVKNNKKAKNEELIGFKTISESEVLKNEQEYEIEMEFLNPNLNSNNSKKIKQEDIFNSLINNIYYMLNIINDSYYILPKSKVDESKNNYMKLIGVSSDSKYFFIGPQPVSLELRNIIDLNDESNINIKNNINIRNNYSVTDKADGERMLLYVDNVGRVFLINNRQKFKYTGVIKTDYKNTIIDGEYIVNSHKKSELLNLYMAFDIYFCKGIDVRDRVLHTEEEMKEKSRLKLLAECCNALHDENQKIVIKMKKFYFGNIEDDGKKNLKIFKESARIYEAEQNGNMFEYYIDGLIYTPINLPVGGKFVGDKSRNDKTWNNVLKWKPPKDNTIDFMIKFTVDKETGIKKKIIKRDDNNNINQYYEINLFVGYDPVYSETLTSFKVLTNQLNKVEDTKYTFNKFTPPSSFENDMHLAYIKINDFDQILTEDGNIINDEYIVEFAYNKESNKSHEYNWIPLRIRFDKTEIFKDTKSATSTANDNKVANNIWKLIQNPVSIDIIKTGLIPSSSVVDVEEDAYYTKDKKDKNLSQNINDFHNKYIKNLQIYSKFKNKNINLLELACGRGGDMFKWVENNYKSVIGIDISSDNIEDKKNDGAWSRYLKLLDQNKEKNNKLTDIIYLVGDVGKNLKNGEAFRDENQYLSKILWGSLNLADIQNEELKDQWGKAKNGFDLICSQFAIHYFFKNKSTLNEYIMNIVENLKEGGYFMATTFDGNTLYNKLYDKNKNEFIIGKKDNEIIWRIDKRYDNLENDNEDGKIKALPNDDSCLGISIDVYVNSINQSITEYLVNFDYLKMEFEKHGLMLVEKEECSELGFLDNTIMFEQYYNQLKIDVEKNNNISSKLKNCLNLSNQEKEFSFINRWFIFKKVNGFEKQTNKKVIKISKNKIKK